MPDQLPACFTAGPPASTAAGPSMTTSVYETHLGVASLTWSRTVLGLLVRAVLRVDDEESETLSFKIRPWLLWKRRGSKKLHVNNRSIDLSWDLSRAKFPTSGGAEPSSGYFLSISVDGDVILVAGDLERAKSKKALKRTPLISRKEHVTMGEERSYSTMASFGGKERSISIDLDGEMSVAVDGKQIVQIRRLRWKFRGSERVDLGGGDRIQISWDLHDWLFSAKSSSEKPSPSSSSSSHAVFVFKFESEQEEVEEAGHCGKEWYFGKNWSESSSSSYSGEKKSGKKKKKRLAKTGSSSSLSSASSSGSSTVMEWASAEEAELRGRRGFSLLIYAWKT